MTWKFALIAWLLACTLTSFAQVTFRITSLPEDTPGNTAIFISGDFEGWSGGKAEFMLGSDSGHYAITLPRRDGTIQFKFTRGSWATVEKGSDGQEIANRTYTFGNEPEVVDIAIAGWASATEAAAPVESTAGPGVQILDENFEMLQLDRSRRVWIYLPPGYETSQASYPVLYMHDGQNLFDASGSFSGEWGVDETLDSLHAHAGLDLIVVGIDNGQNLRIDEYSPWVNPDWGGGEGEAYIDFIAETLKPHIDANYRTLHDPSNTGLMGSSMGGLISHYGGVEEPDVFGRLGVFSPAFALFDSCYAFTAAQPVGAGQKYYFLAGGQESERLDVPAATRRMIDTMREVGYGSEQMHLVIDPQGLHNEAFWRREFGAAILWLFKE